MNIKERANPTKIERVRTAKGISRAELSRLSGVPIRTLENWEWRRTNPGTRQLSKVAKALECPIAELIDDAD